MVNNNKLIYNRTVYEMHRRANYTKKILEFSKEDIATLMQEEKEMIDFENDIEILVNANISLNQIKAKYGVKFEQRIKSLVYKNHSLFRKYQGYIGATLFKDVKINYNALLVYQMKNRLSLEEISQLFGIPEESIQKYIERLRKKDVNYAIIDYSTYNSFTKRVANGKKIPPKFRRVVNKFSITPVIDTTELDKEQKPSTDNGINR